jgi:hypothetical protein
MKKDTSRLLKTDICSVRIVWDFGLQILNLKLKFG